MRLFRSLILAMALASTGAAATISNLQFISDFEGSGVFKFSVDGDVWDLLCHQFEPNATTIPYQANVSTLDDLTGTVLGPQGLLRYQQIAILNILAIQDPSLAKDVVVASRRIFANGQSALAPGPQALYNFAIAADPDDYDLSRFRIFTGINILTQEIGGFDPDFNLNLETPEPAGFLLLGSGLAGLVILRRRRA